MPRNGQIEAFKNMLNAMKEANVLNGVIIVGSWAEYLYKHCNLLDYLLTMRTQDVDVLIKNMNKPSGQVSKALQQHGFIMIPDNNGLMKFDYLGELEVEFLLQERGVGQNKPYKTALNVTAQGLRHMDILLEYCISVNYNGLDVEVPMPFAYILHKLIINSQRQPYKQEKDADAVGSLFNAISEDVKNQMLLVYKTELTKKERIAIIETCNRFPEILEKIKVLLLDDTTPE